MAKPRPKVPVVGLVGGIGSGKSFLARKLRERHPIEIIDADAAGHQVLMEQEVKNEIRRRFGDAVFDSRGEVDRRRLGRLVFGAAPEQRLARTRLEEVVHPRITELLIRQIAQARSQPAVSAVLVDAAVLIEAGWKSLCDVVVFVEAPAEERLARVRASRGWSPDELRLREESQLPLEQKRKEADYVVCNTGTGEGALRQLEAACFSEVSPADSQPI